MITLVGYNENPADFPKQSVEMRPACSPDIRRRLQEAFGASIVTYAGQGFNNGHHRLSGIPGSPDLVVRRVLAPIEALRRRLEREFRVLEHLANAGYPHAPRPFRRLVPGEVDDCPGFAMTFVAGEAINLDPPTCHELGRAMGRLHQIPLPDWLRNAGPTTDPVEILLGICKADQEYLSAMNGDAPAERIDRIGRIVNGIARLLPELDWKDRSENRLLHGDVGAHNCLRGPSGLVLLDWEFAAVSHPLLDIMWLLYRDGFGEVQQRAFFQGYEMEPPESWLSLLRCLHAICVTDQAIWAQSGLNDIAAGRNRRFLRPEDRTHLEGRIQRLAEAEAIILSTGAY